METANHTPVTVETTINLPVAKVWESWSQPAHIDYLTGVIIIFLNSIGP